MTRLAKRTIVRSFAGGIGAFLVLVILLLHDAWGDERYVLKEDDRTDKIAFIDTQLAIKDTEILFAENEKKKEELRAIKAIYERQKQALRENPEDNN